MVLQNAFSVPLNWYDHLYYLYGLQLALINEEMTSELRIPTIIEFYDGDVKYRLEAYLPSAELEKVAQSLA